MLQPGNAKANTTSDHAKIIRVVLAQADVGACMERQVHIDEAPCPLRAPEQFRAFYNWVTRHTQHLPNEHEAIMIYTL